MNKSNFTTRINTLIVLLILLSINPIKAQVENCEPFDFQDMPLGPLPIPGTPVMLLAEYGSPQVVEEVCIPDEDPNSARLQCDLSGTPGDGIRYTTQFGINPTPTFEFGKTYEYSFLKFISNMSGSFSNVQVRVKATNVPISSFDDCPAGDCEVIKTGPISMGIGLCESWYDEYTPSATFDHMVISVSAESMDGEPIFVNIDQICLAEVMDCEALFTYTLDDCGELCVTNLSTGQNLSYLWFVGGAAPSFLTHTTTSFDFCIDLIDPVFHFIELTVMDNNGCVEKHMIDELMTFDNEPPVIICPADSIIQLQDPNCELEFVFPEVLATPASGDYGMVCTLDGIPIFKGQIRLLGPGIHPVICVATDECQNASDTCKFNIIVECKMEPENPQCGYMVATCLGTVRAPEVAVIYDSRYNSKAPFNRDWNDTTYPDRVPSIHPPGWDLMSMGQVFGLATNDQNGDIYLAATDVYALDGLGTSSATGPAGTAGIYKSNLSTLTTNPLVTTLNNASTNTVGTAMLPNTGGLGNGIGNIAYDDVNDQLFASNLEDGRIYRIDPSTGIVLSIFDPLNLDNGMLGLASDSEAVWGIAVYQNKVFFAISPSSKEIRSIALDGSGEFVATQIGTSKLFDDSSSSSIIEVANAPGAMRKFTDIAFSTSGRMMIAERGHPHNSGTFEFVNNGSGWTNGNSFNPGWLSGYPTPRNSAGGVDYGARELNDVVNAECDQLVWASTNYMYGPFHSGYMYGVQGIDAGGNTNMPYVNAATSYFIDFNSSYVTSDKRSIGDVELFNCGCAGSFGVECDSLMVMAMPCPNTCIDSSIITGLPCITVFDPVCGCDGNTYSNSCVAQESGVTIYNPGECDGSNTPSPSGKCCYDIILKNNWGDDIVGVGVDLLTPDWIFNSVQLDTPYIFGNCPILNDQFCILGQNGRPIKSGQQTAMKICFASTSDTAQVPQLVAFNWLQKIEEDSIIVCRDTLAFECPVPPPSDTCMEIIEPSISCNPSDPAAYDLCFFVKNNSPFPVSYITLDNPTPGYCFGDFCTPSTIVFPIPNPLPTGATSQQICIKVKSSIPILSQDTLCVELGMVSSNGDACCHDAVPLCIPVDPCCSPCDQRGISYRKLDDNEECCYSIDISNMCAIPYFQKVSLDIATSGVCFGGHILNPAYNNLFTVTGTNSSICLTPISQFIPAGSFSDIITFCLDKIDAPSKDNPIIKVNWHGHNPATGDTIIACMDSIKTLCPAPNENTCLVVTDQNLECVPDSNKYRYTFTITNQSNPRFIADKLHLIVKNDPTNWIPIPTGNIIPLATPIDSGQSITITTCIAGPVFQAPFNDFIFSYRLQSAVGNDCCYESVCDTIPRPPCEPNGDCCDITEEAFCQYFDGLISYDVEECKLKWNFDNLDSCDVIEFVLPDSTFVRPDIGDSICYLVNSTGIQKVNIHIERWDEDNMFAPCLMKDTCLIIEVINCPPVEECCNISSEDYRAYILGNINLTQDSCEACLSTTLDTCDNMNVQWEQGGTIIGAPIAGTICNNYTASGIYNIAISAWRVDPTNPGLLCVRFDTTFAISIECPGIPPIDVCPSCPNGSIIGNDFIANGDFQAGNTGFQSDYIVGGVGLTAGEYDVRSGSFLGNPNWSAVDHTTATLAGRFLVADGPNPNAAVWRQTVNVIPNNTYIFCAWVNNLVDTTLANNGPPQVEVLINGTTTVVPVTTIDATPDQWILISGSWTAPAGTTNATIEIFNRQVMSFADLAIDDISFVECIQPSIPSCCEDQSVFDSLVTLRWQVTIHDCNVTVAAPQFDSCHWYTTTGPDWGDGSVLVPTITPALNAGPFTHSYNQPGIYTICINVFEGENADSICWSDQMCTTIEITSCCNQNPVCDQTQILVSPNSITNDSCCYEVSINNQYCTNYFKGLSIEMNNGSTISSIQGLNGFTINKINALRAEIFHPTGNIPLGLNQAFTLCGNNTSNIDFTISWLIPNAGGSCDTLCSQAFSRNCNIDDERCVFVTQDSIDCLTDKYCVRIRNNTNPGFVMKSIDLIGITPGGASLTPSPVSIPPLNPGNTSDWICFDYNGVSTGDTVCYFIVGHQDDIPNGEPPTFCCADTVQHCFVIPECPSIPTCCSITQDSFENTFPSLTELINPDSCEICYAFDLDSCSYMSVQFDIGSLLTFGPGGMSTVCQRFNNGMLNTGTATFTHYRLDVNGDTCLIDNKEMDYTKDCSSSIEGCCNADIGQLQLDLTDAMNNIGITDCDLCIPLPEDSCIQTYIEWGDNSDTTTIGGGQLCHPYSSDGTYPVYINWSLFDSLGAPCIEIDTTIDVIIDCMPNSGCDINALIIHNAVTPNEDGLNDFLEIIDPNQSCTIDLSIYNRWGQLVWQIEAYDNSWSGQSHLDQELPDGTYYLFLQLPSEEEEENKDRTRRTFIDLRRDK